MNVDKIIQNIENIGSGDFSSFEIQLATYGMRIATSEVYHYTSPEGFREIIGGKNNCLRFTRSVCLNDSSEGKYIEQIYESSIKKLLDTKSISNEFFDEIKGIRPETIEEVERDTTDEEKERYNEWEKINKSGLPAPEKHYSWKECDTYICCFSKSRDSLPMWNYYSKNDRYEGYNIGFHTGLGWGFYDNAFDVVYSEEEQTQLIEAVVIKAYDVYQKDGDCQKAKQAITYCLTSWRFMFKHSYFQHEEEVRAIYHLPRDRQPHDKPKIEFRTKNGMIIPYVELPFEKQAVSNVTIAPLVTEEIAVETAKQFLVEKGYPHQLVFKSKIPIRY
jgi:hypothetical protein